MAYLIILKIFNKITFENYMATVRDLSPFEVFIRKDIK